MKFTYTIEGVHCSSCIEKIKQSLSPHIQIVKISQNPPELQIESMTEPSLDELNQNLAQIGRYRLSPLMHKHDENQQRLSNYYPIFLILLYIIGIASINNINGQGINWQGWMSQFMAGFFLVFSAFKFLDIKGFAEGYATYDLLAKNWYPYGFIYPFLELGLGILYVGHWFPMISEILTILIMGFSSIGVIMSLMKKQKLKCACLGTILNVPLSSITLIEDLTMVGLAIISISMIK